MLQIEFVRIAGIADDRIIGARDQLVKSERRIDSSIELSVLE